MSASSIAWTLGTIWSLIVIACAAAWADGRIAGGTLVFMELVVFALGGFMLFFGDALHDPPEIVEQIIYRTEHGAPR